MKTATVDYDPRLHEDAVRAGLHSGVRGVPDLRLVRVRYEAHRRLDAAYALEPGEERERVFRQVFALLFDRLGFNRPVPAALEPFPCLADLEGRLVRPAQPRDGVIVELWEQREHRGEGIPAFLVASVPPEWFRDPAALIRALLPGMQRAADLMSDDFGFRREGRVLGSRGVDQAIRRVYDAVWDLSARARLARDGRLQPVDLEGEAGTLAGTARSPVARAIVGFCEIRRPPTHDDLLGIADRIVSARTVDRRDTTLDLARGQRPERRTHRSTYERRCPLCRFPTCEWASTEALQAVAEIIRQDDPSWSPQVGACAHCAERYVLLGQPSPLASTLR